MTDTDRELLEAVYASTRAEELAPVPWSGEQKRAFLGQQFEAQDRAWRERFADVEHVFLVVEVDGVPAGRLYLAVLERELRIVDIALLPAFQRQGIGGSLVGDVVAFASGRGLSTSLHVERWNPAAGLYDRMGFEAVAESDVYLRLERPADRVRAAQEG